MYVFYGDEYTIYLNLIGVAFLNWLGFLIGRI